MFARGSEWRRWDLHLHAPGTALNDLFAGDWDGYLNALEATDVAALGITDYFSIETYSKVREYKKSGRIPNVQLLVPNIEFRILPPTQRREHAINIHLLVSPDDPNHENEIRRALSQLRVKFSEKWYTCTTDDIRQLGRDLGQNINSDKQALAAGAMLYKITFPEFRDWYYEQKWLLSNSLVALAAGDDGLSGIRREDQWQAVHDDLARFAHIMFCSSPRDRAFWLGTTGRDDLTVGMKRLNGPKPCIHGSDAHEVAKVCKPDEDRFCWIKADPTFEGLRQILHEPDERVYIGPSSPAIKYNAGQTIAAVRLSNSADWFPAAELPLNPGLVTVIGKKGSGKSALAELIAHAAGEASHVNDKRSFLKRSQGYLRQMEIELQWADGTSTTAKFGDPPSGEPRVRYLSQSFVEELCAGEDGAKKLAKEIESIVFSFLDPTEKLSASNFDDLRKLRTERIEQQRADIRARIDKATRASQVIHDRKKTLPEKKKQVDALQVELNSITQQLAEGASVEETKFSEDLSVLRTKLSAREQAAALVKRQQVVLDDVGGRVDAFQKSATRFVEEITPLLQQVGLSGEDIAAFTPKFSGDVREPLQRQAAALAAKLQQVEGLPGDGAADTILAIKAAIEELSGRVSADQARRDLIQRAQARLSDIQSQIQRLESEIRQIEVDDEVEIQRLRKERSDAYLEYFETLDAEAEVLEKLYRPVKDYLTKGGDNEKAIQVNIRREVNIDGWLEKGESIIDQRPQLNFDDIRRLEDLNLYARATLEPAWASGEKDKIREAFNALIGKMRKRPSGSAEFLKKNRTYVDLMLWLYSVDHLSLSYGLTYQGVPLESLSPGTKGIVLLILYLGMVRNDFRPLIVDQPEENLDNESIYSDLAGYFRTAKQHRQVVIITHNPNLVVNTDADQVIIAACERRPDSLPQMSYISGSIENRDPHAPDIRGNICRILEGGEPAFKKRENRYDLRRV